MSELTEAINRFLVREEGANDRLFEQIYGELHRLARMALAQERPDHSWETSDLAHECALRLFGRRKPFRNREEFLATVVTTMRRLLIDRARARDAQKRAGEGRRTTLAACAERLMSYRVDLLELQEALDELQHLEQSQYAVIHLYLLGYNATEIAALMQLSNSAVRKKRDHARAFLWLRLGKELES